MKIEGRERYVERQENKRYQHKPREFPGRRCTYINVLQDGVEENVGVYAKEKCLIPAGMGKYLPVQTNRDNQGDVLLEIRDKTRDSNILDQSFRNGNEMIRKY